jgi:putative NADH-flavin reductase
MNLLIFGGTGPTGQQLLHQALAQGHHVTALARKPSALGIQHPLLTLVQGDILDIASIDAAMAGQEVVLSALGVRKWMKNTILSDGTRNILGAMNTHGVRRFVCETSLGVGDSKNDLGKAFNWFFLPVLLKNVFADKEIQERYIKESNLDWTIVRPTYLDDGPLTGDYQVWTGRKPADLTNRISRADTAHFMLKQLITDTYLHQTPGISY